MDCEKYQMLIQEFHDGELEKGKEPLIFTHLSQCADCREFLKGLNQLNLFAQEDLKEIPPRLDEKIFRSIEKKNERIHSNIFTRRIPAYVSYVFGVIIILFGFYIFNSINMYQKELRETAVLMKGQKQQLQLIMNSLPEVQIKAKFANEVIVQAKL